MNETPLHIVTGSKIKLLEECKRDSCKTELSYLVANLVVGRKRINFLSAKNIDRSSKEGRKKKW